MRSEILKPLDQIVLHSSFVSDSSSKDLVHVLVPIFGMFWICRYQTRKTSSVLVGESLQHSWVCISINGIKRRCVPTCCPKKRTKKYNASGDNSIQERLRVYHNHPAHQSWDTPWTLCSSSSQRYRTCYETASLWKEYPSHLDWNVLMSLFPRLRWYKTT